MLTRDQHFARLNSYRRSREYVDYARRVMACSDETIRQMAGVDSLDNLPSLLGVRWRIDERIYNEFLEILPPMRWRGGSFLICEFVFGSITTKYTREGDSYWCEFFDAKGERNVASVSSPT